LGTGRAIYSPSIPTLRANFQLADFVAEATITLPLREGIVLYTDGITETENAEKQLYGIERLCDVNSRHWDHSAEAIKQVVIDDVTRYICLIIYSAAHQGLEIILVTQVTQNNSSPALSLWKRERERPCPMLPPFSPEELRGIGIF
jgi:hypothetical protein